MRLNAPAWLALAVGLSMYLTGCGSADSDSQLQAEDPNDDPLIVVMGGNTSCGRDSEDRSNSPYGMGLYAPTFELLNDVRSRMGVEPKFVISCYDNTPNVSYSMTSQQENIYRGTRQELDEVIAREMNPEAPLFFAGHSYGGWLAMKSSLVMAEQRAFTGLVTIDPISRVECSFSRPAGCTRSPQDIVVEEREYINERTDQWINLYQTRTFYLHASPYDEADMNERINASHTRIDTHERTWELITEMIEQYY